MEHVVMKLFVIEGMAFFWNVIFKGINVYNELFCNAVQTISLGKVLSSLLVKETFLNIFRYNCAVNNLYLTRNCYYI